MDNVKCHVAVLGAGSWGTALAILLGSNGVHVNLWGHSSVHLTQLSKDRQNQKYLPGFFFHRNVNIIPDLKEAVTGVRDILFAVPSHAFRTVLLAVRPFIQKDARVICGTKGMDSTSNQFFHTLVSEFIGDETPMAVLSGPSLAREVVAQMPTALSLAYNNEEFADFLIPLFHTPFFRIYKNSDLVGVELCGILKNVLAIAVGISDGLGLGDNARSALITRGLAEMMRLCLLVGGKEKTVMGLAGLGDLILTATSNQSRNRRFGLAIGEGKTVEVASKEIAQAIEGLYNTKLIYQMAENYEVDMPITQEVYKMIYESKQPKEAVNALLSRSPNIE